MHVQGGMGCGEVGLRVTWPPRSKGQGQGQHQPCLLSSRQHCVYRKAAQNLTHKKSQGNREEEERVIFAAQPFWCCQTSNTIAMLFAGEFLSGSLIRFQRAIRDGTCLHLSSFSFFICFLCISGNCPGINTVAAPWSLREFLLKGVCGETVVAV